MRRSERAGWLVAGVSVAALAALLLVPTGALSAVTTQLVSITDASSGRTAQVDKAHQVLASPADTNQLVSISGGVEGHNCQTLYTVPAGKALVLTGGNAVFSLQNTAYGDFPMFTNGNQFDELAASSEGGEFQTVRADFGTGTTIQPGAAITACWQGASSTAGYANVYFYGYLIPGAAAPSSRLSAMHITRPDR